MGNDQSYLSGLEIEEKSIEVSDFWSQHSATIINSGHVTSLSVFISERFVDSPLWVSHTPLEKNSKNLMIYRHPCILKYISSWHKSSKFYLAVEDVTPLALVLSKQNTLQVCIGLHSILKALCFLHDKASISHNNICTASIFVTKDGNYKLGGMEYLCSYKDLTSDYLSKSKLNRYNKAIDPNEEQNLNIASSRKDSVDIYAFSVLVCETLKTRDHEDVPSLAIFRDFCKNNLQNLNVQLRPKLNSLLKHEFFNHDFITIHSFLVELPLKMDDEKMHFFQSLLEHLKKFSEVTVASQLGNLLLSRLVLLNKTAQNELLPAVLCPKQDASDGLFTDNTFKKYLVPKLLEIFTVRDAQIRLLLLNHFPNFIHTFTKEELQSCILPELLLGIKDTNDNLVAVTLHTLADLIPLLGAAAVVGGKRAKLFNDGRPTNFRKTNNKHNDNTSIQNHPLNINVGISENNQTINLPERPRPDGEEVETSTEEIEPSADEDLDNWDEWSVNETNNASNNLIPVHEEQEVVINIPTNISATVTKKALPDISKLDIKNQTDYNNTNEEFDFFQDMEPVIETSTKFVVEEDINLSTKLHLNVEDNNEDGWGEEDWE